MVITLYKVFSKTKTINIVIKINSFLEMEGIQLFPGLLLNTGTFPILKYFSTWCSYNIIPILLNGPTLLLYWTIFLVHDGHRFSTTYVHSDRPPCTSVGEHSFKSLQLEQSRVAREIVHSVWVNYYSPEIVDWSVVDGIACMFFLFPGCSKRLLIFLLWAPWIYLHDYLMTPRVISYLNYLRTCNKNWNNKWLCKFTCFFPRLNMSVCMWLHKSVHVSTY